MCLKLSLVSLQQPSTGSLPIYSLGQCRFKSMIFYLLHETFHTQSHKAVQYPTWNMQAHYDVLLKIQISTYLAMQMTTASVTASIPMFKMMRDNITVLETTLADIKQWMETNRLMMNSVKTGFIYVGSQYILTNCQSNC